MSGDRYTIGDQNGVYFLSFTVVDWIDVFTRKEYKTIITDALNYCSDNKGLQIYAWCLMPSHLHLIASVTDDFKLSNVIRDFKILTWRKSVTCDLRF